MIKRLLTSSVNVNDQLNTMAAYSVYMLDMRPHF